MTESNLDESIAWAMETNVRLLPVLPDLLSDLWELGTSSDQIVSALRSLDMKPKSLVLDLGCGKGAVAVALARHLGLRVEGVDGFPPFLRSARMLAERHRVGTLCSFRRGDIRELLGQEGNYDAVLLLSVGPVSGNHELTIAGLRTLVRQGGYIVIEDGFLAEGVEAPPRTDGYASHSETLRHLTAFGDQLVWQEVSSAEETRAVNETNTDVIRRRADLVKARYPDMSALIDEYVARQELETKILGTDLVCATWVLRRT